MRTGISAEAKDGVNLLEMGLVRESGRAFAKGLKANPDDLECLLGLSRVLMSMGQERTAVPVLQHYLKLKPNQPEAVSHLAKMRAVRGDAEALDALRILSEHPKAQYFEHLNYGTALLALNRLEEAEKAFLRAQDAEPDSPFPIVSLGIIAQRRGDAQAAQEAFREATEIDEKQAYPLLLIAQSHITQGRFNDALQALNEGLRRDPEAANLHIERIKLLLGTGAAEEAFKVAGHFRKFEPKNPEGAHLQGLAAMISGRGDFARNALEEAIRLAPTAYEPHLTLARLEGLAKNSERQRELLEKAVSLAPKASAPAIDLSTFQLRAGEIDAAIAGLRDALTREPNHPALNLNMALALVKSDAAKALEHARKAASSKQKSVAEQGQRLVAQLTA